jgi:hypothetical protein
VEGQKTKYQIMVSSSSRADQTVPGTYRIRADPHTEDKRLASEIKFFPFFRSGVCLASELFCRGPTPDKERKKNEREQKMWGQKGSRPATSVGRAPLLEFFGGHAR